MNDIPNNLTDVSELDDNLPNVDNQLEEIDIHRWVHSYWYNSQQSIFIPNIQQVRKSVLPLKKRNLVNLAA